MHVISLFLLLMLWEGASHHPSTPFILSLPLSLCFCVEKQKAELTQQHTEWVRQITKRHMEQIEDLQNELQTHTELLALQQVSTTTHLPIHGHATS